MIVVTGGAGFIGSNLVAALEAHGRGPIVVCDTFGDGDKWRNLAKRDLHDIVRPDRLMEWLRWHGGRLEAIFHMGAISATTETDVDRIIEANIRLTLDLWAWCARSGTPLIHASSAATYGDGAAGFADDPTAEALARLRPLNGYGWSKLMVDRRILRDVAAAAAVPRQWAALRFFNVYGPNEYHKGDMRSVIAKLYPRLAAGGSAQLFRSYRPDYPDGGQRRDFIYVDDCVAVMLWLLDHPDVSGLFNVGTGRAESWVALAEAMFAAIGRPPEIAFIEMPESLRPKYQYFTEARVDRLRAAGYDKAFTSLGDGVARYVEGYLSQNDPYR